MPVRDEENVEVPFFGAADQGSAQAQTSEMLLASQTIVTKRGGSWIHSFFIVILLGSVSAMLYWGNDFLQDQQQRILLAEATEARIADLEQLLEDSQDQAKKSGQTLQQRLDEQKKQVQAQKALMDVQYLEYQQKFSVLIETANNKQASQLALFNAEISKLELKVKNAQEDAQEEMGFMTSQQKTALSGLEERLVEIDAIRTNLTNIEIAQTRFQGHQQGLIADLETLTKEVSGGSNQADSQLENIKKELLVLETNLDSYQGSSHKSFKALSAKVSVIAKKAAPKLSAAVLDRLKKTENAIKAFDGTRAQVNKDIQRLKSKVNKIQLQLQ
ncbi:MAG: hypothetical protein HRU05_15735 [Oceanospirillaceae bacterium]|nr:hypothetical protein [Oceanospirillaceae bacterium]